MPNVALHLGANVDIASTADVHQAVRDMKAVVKANQSPTPIRRRIVAGNSTAVNFSGYSTTRVCVSPLSPGSGRSWNLRSVCVFDAADSLTVNNNLSIAVCCGDAGAPTVLDINATRHWDQGAPYSLSFDESEFEVSTNDDLYVVAFPKSPATVPTGLTAVFCVDDYPSYVVEADRI